MTKDQIRAEFEKWWPSVGQTIGEVTAWEAWQAAHAKYGTTNSSKWRVDDLLQDVNGDIFTIEGFKGDKLLIKDASENLWLTLADELTWHSRATQEEQ